jgi:hypothetical protein
MEVLRSRACGQRTERHRAPACPRSAWLGPGNSCTDALCEPAPRQAPEAAAQCPACREAPARERTAHSRWRPGTCGTLANRWLPFPDLADEPEPLAGDRSDQALFLAAVADGPARRIDLTGERRFRDDRSASQPVQQLILADDADDCAPARAAGLAARPQSPRSPAHCACARDTNSEIKPECSDPA